MSGKRFSWKKENNESLSRSPQKRSFLRSSSGQKENDGKRLSSTPKFVDIPSDLRTEQEIRADLGLSSLLPDEIWSFIFSLLTPENLYYIAQVCRLWNKISSCDFVWKQFCSSFWELESETTNEILPSLIHSSSSMAYKCKALYISWLRRMTSKYLSHISYQQKFVQKMYKDKEYSPSNSGSSNESGNNSGISRDAIGGSPFFPVPFFWPSFMTLRQRYTLKILVVGNQSVGKTALCVRFTDGNFVQHAKSELKMKTINVFDHVTELQILDSGYEDFHNSKLICYLQAHAIMICFDLSDSSSSFQVTFSDEITTVGCKSDLIDQVTYNDQIKEFMKVKGIKSYTQTSAKNDTNVSDCFQDISKFIFKSIAWPNYIPPEHILRTMIRIPEESSWGLSPIKTKSSSKGRIEGSRESNKSSEKCIMQ